MRRSGTYRYTECLNCPDGQIEWTRSGSWYADSGRMYPNDAAYPPESGTEDNDPDDVQWAPDEGETRDVATMPPAFQAMVAGWIERYQDEHEPEPDIDW